MDTNNTSTPLLVNTNTTSTEQPTANSQPVAKDKRGRKKLPKGQLKQRITIFVPTETITRNGGKVRLKAKLLKYVEKL